MRKIEYKHFISEWSELCPEFLEWEGYDPEYYTHEGEPQPYTYLGDFCVLMMQKVEADSSSDDQFFMRIFQVINQQYELSDADPDPDTLNLIGVEIFENLAQSKRGIEICRKWLTNKKAIDDFRGALEYVGGEVEGKGK